MAFLRGLLQYACSVLLFVSLAQALKFDLQAHAGHEQKPWRCIQNFVGKDTLVVVTAIISGQRGDGMTVNMHVGCQSHTRAHIPVQEELRDLMMVLTGRFLRRSRTQSVTTTESQRTSLANSEPSSPRTPMPPSKCASKIP